MQSVKDWDNPFLFAFSLTEPIASIKVGDRYDQPTSIVTDLGVTLDSHLTFVPHVNNTWQKIESILAAMNTTEKNSCPYGTWI